MDEPRPRHPEGLETEDQLAFQRRAWSFQRAMWALMVLVIAGALLGLFGSGPLSRGRATDGPVLVEYQRFLRHQTDTHIRVHVPGGPGEVKIAIDGEYLGRFRVHQVTPRPHRVESESGTLVYVFASGPSGRSVRLDLEPESVGVLHGRLGVAGGSFLTFTQFVYP